MAYMVLNVERNEEVKKIDDLTKYVNSLNKGNFMGFAEKTWHMMVRGRPIPNHRDKLWRVSYAIRYNARGWDLRLLDHGRYSLDANKSKIPFKNDEGDNVLGNLDGFGGALAAGKPPKFRQFVRKPVVAWGPLRIPRTIEKFYSVRVIG